MAEFNKVLKGFLAESTVYGKRFVVWGTDPKNQAKVPTGATYALGVVEGDSGEEFADGEAIDVAVSGIVEVAATAAVITAGQSVYVDTNGRVTAQGAGAATQYCVGIAHTTTTGTLDDLVEVELNNHPLTVHA